MQLAYIELIGYISIPLECNICMEELNPTSPLPHYLLIKKNAT